MPFELAQVVAGFPLAASFAIAGGITVLREGRRRASLNEAVHELRRPLQVLSLSLTADAPRSLESSLRMAAAAVDRLEREINGEMTAPAVESVSIEKLVETAIDRWGVHAALMNRSLVLHSTVRDPRLRGHRFELEQALDNVISNAFTHGSGEIVVEVREDGGLLQLAVLDSGGLASPRRLGIDGWLRLGGRGRHGHGLRVVRRAARRHGGRFHLRGTRRGTEALLEFPLRGGSE